MHVIYVFFFQISRIIPVIFTRKLKNTNCSVRFQERSIPVEFKMLFQ